MDDDDPRQDGDERPEDHEQPDSANWPLGLDADDSSPEEEGYGYGV